MKAIQFVMLVCVSITAGTAHAASGTNLVCQNSLIRGGDKFRRVVTVKLTRGVLVAKIYKTSRKRPVQAEVSKDLSQDSGSYVYSSKDITLTLSRDEKRGTLKANVGVDKWDLPVRCTGRF